MPIRNINYTGDDSQKPFDDVESTSNVIKSNASQD